MQNCITGRSFHAKAPYAMIRPARTRHHAALSTCPCSLLRSRLCTQWITSSAPSPQQLSSLLGLPSTHQDLMHGPSLSCQGRRVLYAPWGMQLTQGTNKLSPEASGCGIHRNRRIADPLQSHHHLEAPLGDAASPNCQDDSWGTSLHNRAGPLQHPTGCVVNSSVTAILVCSKRTRMIMHTP